MSLDPSSARSRSPSPSRSHLHEHRASTPYLRPSNAPPSTPSPSGSPAMLPCGLGLHNMDVAWDTLPESAHSEDSYYPHDRYQLTGRKGYNALPSTPPTRYSSPAHGYYHHNHSSENTRAHHHNHHNHHNHEHDLAPPNLSTEYGPIMPHTPPHHSDGLLGGRKGYNATMEHCHYDPHLPFSPVEVGGEVGSGGSSVRRREHSCGSMARKTYSSTPRSLSPRSMQ